jgi:hypothetical protein
LLEGGLRRDCRPGAGGFWARSVNPQAAEIAYVVNDVAVFLKMPAISEWQVEVGCCINMQPEIRSPDVQIARSGIAHCACSLVLP